MQKSISNKFSPKLLNVLPNSKIKRPKSAHKDTRLIELLAEATTSNCQLLSEFFIKDSYLLSRNKESFQDWVASHISGQKAAQFVIDNHPECFTYDPSNGLFKCYASSKTLNYDKDSPQIKDLEYMTNMHDLEKSLELYNKIMKTDPKKLNGHPQILKIINLICTDLILKYYGASIKNPNEILLCTLTKSSQQDTYEAAKNKAIEIYNTHKTEPNCLPLTNTVVIALFETKQFKTVVEILDGHGTEFINSLSSKAKSCFLASKMAIYSSREDSTHSLIKLHEQFIEDALDLNISFSTPIYNSFLHGMSEIRSNKPRAPFSGLASKIMHEMEHNGIKPDLETISLLHSCLSSSELFSESVGGLFIKYLEKITYGKSADYSICIKYPDIFNKIIRTFFGKGCSNEAIQLYNIFKKLKGYAYGFTPANHHSFLNSYCQILVDTLPLSHVIIKMKEIVPSSCQLSGPIVRYLLDKIIATREFEYLIWVYQVDVRLYSGYSFQKQLFLGACSRALLDTKFKPNQDFLMTLENFTCKEIDFVTSTYKTSNGLFQFDLVRNSDFLKYLIIMACKLECSGKILKLKERFLEKSTGKHIMYEPAEFEAVEEFVEQHEGFRWLLEFMPHFKS